MYVQEELLALPRPLPPVTHLRGHAIVVSLSEIEARGLGTRYWAKVPSSYQQKVREVSPLSWVDMEITMAHYRAIDGLGLDEEVCIDIGRAAATRAQSAVIATIVRGLRVSGNLSPATLLRRMDVIWGRLVQGGGARTVQTGPKDLRCELHGAPFAELRYNRLAWLGYFESGMAPAARRVIVRQLPQPAAQAAAYAFSWV